MEPKERELGRIRISDEVISAILINCVRQVEGIACLAEGVRGGAWVKMWGTGEHKRIRIEGEPESLEKRVEIHVLVEFGYNIPDVAAQLQRLIKQETERIAGVVIAEVDVHVDGLKAPTGSSLVELNPAQTVIIAESA